jgi:hypothetical protein
MAQPVTVVIADDQRLARQELRLILESEPGIQVQAETSDAAGRKRRFALGDRQAGTNFRPPGELARIGADLPGFRTGLSASAIGRESRRRRQCSRR